MVKVGNSHAINAGAKDSYKDHLLELADNMEMVGEQLERPEGRLANSRPPWAWLHCEPLHSACCCELGNLSVRCKQFHGRNYSVSAILFHITLHGMDGGKLYLQRLSEAAKVCLNRGCTGAGTL